MGPPRPLCHVPEWTQTRREGWRRSGEDESAGWKRLLGSPLFGVSAAVVISRRLSGKLRDFRERYVKRIFSSAFDRDNLGG